MSKRRHIRFFTVSFLILMTVWVATPKFYIHNLLGHDHSAIEIGLESKVSTQSSDDCDFDNYNKPSYFSIFKFICSFIPTKKHHSSVIRSNDHVTSTFSHNVALFRGPPVV